MKVLVVGGTGLLGATVADRLDAGGATVVTLARGRAHGADPELAADVCRTDLGLAAPELDELRASVTHIVSCYGSVEWGGGPRLAFDLHRRGTVNLLDFAETCPRLKRFVHLSSILVLGRAKGVVGNAHLEVGQTFRSWYEYGKYLAEREVRRRDRPYLHIIRVGPVLGGARTPPHAATHGLLSAVPPLLRGYPIHLQDVGRFPCYVSDVDSATEVIVRALEADDSGVWTYFDPKMPTLGRVLTGLCSPWGVVPRIVESRGLRLTTELLAPRLGFPPTLVSYTEPWFELDPDILDELPFAPPVPQASYIEETGRALRANAGLLT